MEDYFFCVCAFRVLRVIVPFNVLQRFAYFLMRILLHGLTNFSLQCVKSVSNVVPSQHTGTYTTFMDAQCVKYSAHPASFRRTEMMCHTTADCLSVADIRGYVENVAHVTYPHVCV